jgi:hypothetical protein
MTSAELPDNSIMESLKNANWLAGRVILARQGFIPATSESLDDQQVRGSLWELIYALAARGCYLACTDHLSDRELLEWLHVNWVNEAVADLPVDATCRLRLSPVTSVDEKEGTTIWLRFYADEDERMQFAAELVPPHEDPGYDRDRFLPVGPVPVDEGEDGGDFEALDEDIIAELEEYHEEQEDESDPLGLKAVDAAISSNYADCEDLEAEFGDEMLKEKWEKPIQVLHNQGVLLFPPDEHTDDTIGAALWELLHELASRGFYTLHTDHLSDRDLYTALWKDSLREPAKLHGLSATAAWYYDFIGGGTPADEQLRLRYYATHEQRITAKRDNPRLKLPPRQKPVANRDWRLPKGPF